MDMLRVKGRIALPIERVVDVLIAIKDMEKSHWIRILALDEREWLREARQIAAGDL